MIDGAASARILLVDDDSLLVDGLTAALERAGYHVLTVPTALEALAAVPQFRPDLMLLDVMMPGYDGWHVLQQLRTDPSTANVPVIMLTASAAPAAKVKGFSLGADDYVTKPFSIQELRCRIAAVLRRTNPGSEPEQSCFIPVIGGSTGHDIVRCKDVFFVEGIRNYSHVHTADNRFLSRLTLGAIEQRDVEGFMRVHRSFIVNLGHVRGCRWASRSSYRLRLSDEGETEIPVSRHLVSQLQSRLGLGRHTA